MCSESGGSLKKLPDVELLSECVDYNPDTGALTWKRRPVEHFSSYKHWKIWLAKFEGKPVRKVNNGYVVVVITINKKETYSMGHRVAWALTHGEWPRSQIDHINGNRMDNRICNLRLASHKENQRNKGAGLRNKSGFKGVHFSKTAQKWIAQIHVNGKTRHIGVFDSALAASKEYCAAANKEHGEFACAK